MESKDFLNKLKEVEKKWKNTDAVDLSKDEIIKSLIDAKILLQELVVMADNSIQKLELEKKEEQQKKAEEGRRCLEKIDAGKKIDVNWYQTDDHIIITFPIKNLQEHQIKKVIKPKKLEIDILMSEHRTYTQEFNLPHEIVVAECTYKINQMNLEIKLKKEKQIKWSKLEVTDLDELPKKGIEYPSSAKKKSDWEKINRKIKESEKDEPNDFSKIYQTSDDDTKKAMEKSLTESCGTVLNMNWGKVGQKQCKPFVEKDYEKRLEEKYQKKYENYDGKYKKKYERLERGEYTNTSSSDEDD